MKKSKLTQIKGLDLKELRLKTKFFKDEIANLLMDKNMKKIKDLKIISKKRKDLAQVLTIIRQKELLGQLESRVRSPAEGEARQSRQESSGKEIKIQKKGVKS